MKKILLFSFLLTLFVTSKAQVAGDTIVVQAFDYAQTTYGQGNRTKMVSFPSQAGLSFEKILMLYNMRCKGAGVGNWVPPSGTSGCGEWDYSCNTYITDSTQIDSIKASHPSHIIPGFTGTSFNYSNQVNYTYYKFNQVATTYTSVISETLANIGTQTSSGIHTLPTSDYSGKTQYVWLASELSGAGLTAGDITGLKLFIDSAGSDAKFLRINMKHTTQSTLNANNPDLNGFTTVYFLNTPFSVGVQSFNFSAPFNWNGTSNILVEFSFTNAGPGTNTFVQTESTPGISCLYAHHDDKYYEFNPINPISLNNSFSSLANEISIGFWSNGNGNYLPSNTSILHGHTITGTRELNVHLPWSNSRVYFDCGSANNTDRIEVLDSMNEFKNKWNHWTFTKNSTTGSMKIYLNGVSWLIDSNKTKPITLSNLVLGSGYNNTVPYFGKMDDFTIWNAELNGSQIQNNYRKVIDNTNLQWSSLKAYYKLDEGNGNSCYDAATNDTSNATNGVWRRYKGHERFKQFTEINERPVITFVKGVYTSTAATTAVMDSTVNYPYKIYSFSTNGLIITPVDTQLYYNSGYTYVYDGLSNMIIDSVLNPSLGNIAITQLIYYPHTPARYQIMSFVTPYGNGMNLGATGRTWTFDVTDFAPIMKGDKLMTMDAGGQWQEDMDVKFLFIVGTPPREVKDIKNIWRVDHVGYNNILNNSYFEPRTVPLASNAVSYKIRSAITGHGQQGEFIPQTHFIDVNGSQVDQWSVWKTCGDNPIYPQGGTWPANRAGWCPGMATDLKEIMLSPSLTPGSTVQVDYGVLTAQGDSRYWVSNQLVSYGAPNHAVDAAIINIKNPSTKVEYARSNSICAHPKIVIQNTGSTALTSATIDFWVNNNTVHQVHQWSGNLGFMESEEVTLYSNDSLWQELMANNNVFHAEIKSLGSGTDAYSLNNHHESAFVLTPILPSNLWVQVSTNLSGFETEYMLIREWGDTILYKNNLSNVATYNDSLVLPMGCYQFIINDSGGDGLSYWANNDGNGVCRLRKTSGQIMKTITPDFGNSSIFNFTVDHPLSYEEVNGIEELNVYPNPAHNQLTVDIPLSFQHEAVPYFIINSFGEKILSGKTSRQNKLIIDVHSLPKGLYLLQIGKFTEKIMIE